MRYHFADGQFLSQRAVAVGSILALHVLFAYLLLTSLVQAPDIPMTRMRVVITPSITPVDPVQQRADFRPPEPGRIQQPSEPRVSVPEPLAPVDTRAPRLDAVGGGSAATAVAAPVRLIGRNQLPDTQEYYPAEERRLGIEGAANVRVCVNEAGALSGEPAIEASSGNARLDAGAMNVARHGRYARSVQGDTPVGNCFRFRVNFRMK